MDRCQWSKIQTFRPYSGPVNWQSTILGKVTLYAYKKRRWQWWWWRNARIYIIIKWWCDARVIIYAVGFLGEWINKNINKIKTKNKWWTVPSLPPEVCSRGVAYQDRTTYDEQRWGPATNSVQPTDSTTAPARSRAPVNSVALFFVFILFIFLSIYSPRNTTACIITLASHHFIITLALRHHHHCHFFLATVRV